MKETNLEDLIEVLTILNKANKALVSNDQSENAVNVKKFILHKIRLNSPLTMELIVTGLGAAFILIQIIDKINSWGKLSLEKEKLKLEIIKAAKDLSPEHNKEQENKVKNVAKDLSKARLQIKSCKIKRRK